MLRKKYDHSFIGQSTTVLKDEFVQAVLRNDDLGSIETLPFVGPPRLPTKMECLKLHLFLRDNIGKNNWTVSKSQISECSSSFIKKVLGYVRF